jgi:acetyl-CoA C-acetyltransferase
MKQAVIISAARTPTGKFLGGLKEVPATRLGAIAVREAVARAGIEAAIVDECIMGNVISAGLGQNPASPTKSPPSRSTRFADRA